MAYPRESASKISYSTVMKKQSLGFQKYGFCFKYKLHCLVQVNKFFNHSGNSLTPSETQFPHLEDGGDYSTSPQGWSLSLNERICGKHLGRHKQSKDNVPGTEGHQGGMPQVPSNGRNWENKDLALQGDLSSLSISLTMLFTLP